MTCFVVTDTWCSHCFDCICIQYTVIVY